MLHVVRHSELQAFLDSADISHVIECILADPGKLLLAVDGAK